MLKPLVFLVGIYLLPALLFPFLAHRLSNGTVNKVKAHQFLTLGYSILFILGVILLAGGNAIWGLNLIIQEAASTFGDFHPLTRILQRDFVPLATLIFFITAAVIPHTAIEHRFRGTSASWLRYLALMLPVTVIGLAQFVAVAFWFFYVQRLFRLPVLRFFTLAGGISLILAVFGFLAAVLKRISYRSKPISESNEQGLITKTEKLFQTHLKSIVVLDTESVRNSEVRASIFGVSKIFIPSTLFTVLSEDEKIALIGHEIARTKLHHIVKSRLITLGLVTLASWLLFGVISSLIPVGPYRNILFYSVVFLCLFILIYTIPGLLRRRWAYQADIYVATRMGGPGPMISLLRKAADIDAGVLQLKTPALERRVKRISDAFDNRHQEPTAAALAAFRDASPANDATEAAILAYRSAEKKSKKLDE